MQSNHICQYELKQMLWYISRLNFFLTALNILFILKKIINDSEIEKFEEENNAVFTKHFRESVDGVNRYADKYRYHL